MIARQSYRQSYRRLEAAVAPLAEQVAQMKSEAPNANAAPEGRHSAGVTAMQAEATTIQEQVVTVNQEQC